MYLVRHTTTKEITHKNDENIIKFRCYISNYLLYAKESNKGGKEGQKDMRQKETKSEMAGR